LRSFFDVGLKVTVNELFTGWPDVLAGSNVHWFGNADWG
jgi:hypothetical protein